ncbi:ST6GALNAC2 isoform 5 [Pongo abelii]|uniref:ST6GALNAC2 isoform 5 n=1 Tax=Pongo abelii TaxID=9601 RepID=A0A2J8Y1D4_PONAB|nr:ST6GALNAC2 isoform 5 [Pongo abelii]
MGLPRGPFFWLLLLLTAACSGLLFALYFSAVQRYPEPAAGARARPADTCFTWPFSSTPTSVACSISPSQCCSGGTSSPQSSGTA